MHVAIIMDGNGRWATARGLPRVAGHRAGADAARRVIEASPGLGIGTLSLFAFSSDNWSRPPGEVDALMELMRAYLRSETRKCIENGVRLQFIGRRDRISDELKQSMRQSESATAGGRKLHLRVAIDYSARDAIVSAARQLQVHGGLSREEISCLLTPDVDLLIRTGGEQRLSDFLLWECAYAELIFSRRMWPDYDGQALRRAVDSFRARDRRFGGVAQSDAV